MLQNLSSAAVVIGAVRVNSASWEIFHALSSAVFFSKSPFSKILQENHLSVGQIASRSGGTNFRA